MLNRVTLLNCHYRDSFVIHVQMRAQVICTLKVFLFALKVRNTVLHELTFGLLDFLKSLKYFPMIIQTLLTNPKAMLVFVKLQSMQLVPKNQGTLIRITQRFHFFQCAQKLSFFSPDHQDRYLAKGEPSSWFEKAFVLFSRHKC